MDSYKKEDHEIQKETHVVTTTHVVEQHVQPIVEFHHHQTSKSHLHGSLSEYAYKSSDDEMAEGYVATRVHEILQETPVFEAHKHHQMNKITSNEFTRVNQLVETKTEEK